MSSDAEPLLQFFSYMLRDHSRPFCHLALQLVETLPRNPERTAALRKLLEAKTVPSGPPYGNPWGPGLKPAE